MTDCTPSLSESVSSAVNHLCSTHTYARKRTHTQSARLSPARREQSREDNLRKRRPAVKGQQSWKVTLHIIYRLLNKPRPHAPANSPFSSSYQTPQVMIFPMSTSAYWEMRERERELEEEEIEERDRKKTNTAIDGDKDGCSRLLEWALVCPLH